MHETDGIQHMIERNSNAISCDQGFNFWTRKQFRFEACNAVSWMMQPWATIKTYVIYK